MVEVCDSYYGPPLPDSRNHTVLSTRSTVDAVALSMVKPEIIAMKLFPVTIIGNGNCLSRTLSVLAYGNQFHKDEMTARLTYEGVIHKSLYLSDDYLRNGVNHIHKSANLPQVFSQYSG
jgi:hypothetical protein